MIMDIKYKATFEGIYICLVYEFFLQKLVQIIPTESVKNGSKCDGERV